MLVRPAVADEKVGALTAVLVALPDELLHRSRGVIKFWGVTVELSLKIALSPFFTSAQC